jgi:DNA polymerase-3 subunit alpha
MDNMDKLKVLPLFKTQYSIGKSILTLAAPDKLDRSYPVSIFDIAKEHKLSEVVVVDDSISGFLEAHQNAKKAGIKLVYGLQLRCMENIESKSEASLKTIHKLVIFIKNNQGYKDLIKISSTAAKKGFYYKPNIDMAHLKTLWTENLMLGVPFYDSFLFNNTLYGYRCVPTFFTPPVFFLENSDLPFDNLIQQKVKSYAETSGAEIIPSRSIYYYKKDDFLAYLTFRCINERTLLEKPELEHMSSNLFCFEEWENQNKFGTIEI